MGVKAPIAFRVNPDVDAGTHDKIATGRKEDKFGIAIADAHRHYELASKMEGIRIEGVATHIGSQLTSLEPMRKAFEKVIELTKELQSKGHTIQRLDLGGGLGIPYKEETPPAPSSYAEMILEVTQDLDCQLVFEPGRLIAGNAGLLITRIIYIKDTGHRKFYIVDAAMNDLSRPTMYDAYHKIIPVAANNEAEELVDIVGPVCETGDYFAKQRPMPPCKAGDLIAIRSCGAYGATMASEYNSRPLIPEVLVQEDQFAIIRKRPSFEEMTSYESIPDWLK
jgi:diaminopimelate decarboxylase